MTATSTEEKQARELRMNHKHCIFCREEIPNPYPSNWDSVCKSPANTLEPDTVGNRHHAFLAPANLEEEFAKVGKMLKENDFEGLAAYANKNNRERAKKRVRELTEQRERGDGSAEEWRDLAIGCWFFHDSPNCDHRYSVQERTSGGCSIVCSTPYVHEQAKRDMQEIAKAHNEAYASSRLAAQQQNLYQAYLLGCEDECIPEPKTFEKFMETWRGE